MTRITNKEFERVYNLLRDFNFALDAEIDAVRQRPSRDTLVSGVYRDGGVSGQYDYLFKSSSTGIRFAENIKGKIGEKQFSISFVDAVDDEIRLRFPENLGAEVVSVDLEWENDFVLRRMQDQLQVILTREDEAQFDRIASLFCHDDRSRNQDSNEAARIRYLAGEVDIRHDGQRNDAQIESIQKALVNPVSFVWGPPGTGKTSTLGYIMANFMLAGKRVLFLSNTNRAVDVGIVSLMEALHSIGESAMIGQITRFGDIALNSEALERVHLEKLAEQRKNRIKKKAVDLQTLLARFESLHEAIEKAELEGNPVSSEINMELDLLVRQIRKHGGPGKIREFLDTLSQQMYNAEFAEMQQKQVVGTTLARMCTSELMTDQEFDAIVIDEASMASLPYLAIMATRCTAHLVIAGDPMQLPPIALSDVLEVKEALEQDIFMMASGANHPLELFEWHDRNPTSTTFFDVQYRMRADLATIISEVFYEGRLKTLDTDRMDSPGIGYSVIDSSPMEPQLINRNRDYGFSPGNQVHRDIVLDLIHRLMFKEMVPAEQIGVIVPFRASVWDFKIELKKKGYEGVEVGTIHTFQGREKKVIIFDTVMTAEHKNGRAVHFSVRPFDETKNGITVHRLLNVAFSRARDRLFIIADMKHIQKLYSKKILGKLLSRLNERS